MDELDYNLLGKILAGEADEKEKARFDDWLNQSGENREIYRAYQNFYHNSTIAETTAVENRSKQAYLHVERPKSRRIYRAAAASIALIIAGALVFFGQLNRQPEDQLNAGVIVKTNPSGQKSKILLPDGSSVWLNANSSIEYHESFTDSLRRVSLTGEAYFDVVKDAKRPFVVEAGYLKTTVLGTAFNIANYEEDKVASVSLASGKIQVEQAERTTVLTPGLQVRFDKSSKQLTTENIDVAKIALWKSGILVFEQEDFESVITRLERWYDVEITVTGRPSPEWKFTGYFDNEYLKNVLEVLSFGKELSYKIEGKKVELIRRE